MRLYEIGFAFQQMIDLLDDPDIDAQAWCDTLDALAFNLEDKAVGYAAISKTMDHYIESLDAEIKKMQDYRKSLKARQDYLKKSLFEVMLLAGVRKIDSDPRFKISIRKNGGVQPMWISENIADVPEEFITYEPKINSTKIRKYLEDGNVAAWAHLNERGESLVLK